MENITKKDNLETLNKLQSGLNDCWDIFFYGDKVSGTKPGDIKVYGAICGIREVGQQRLKLQEALENQTEEMGFN